MLKKFFNKLGSCCKKPLQKTMDIKNNIKSTFSKNSDTSINKFSTYPTSSTTTPTDSTSSTSSTTSTTYPTGNPLPPRADSFKKREYANEERYFREKEKERLANKKF